MENAKNKNKNMGSGLKDQISHCQNTSSKVFGSHYQKKKFKDFYVICGQVSCYGLKFKLNVSCYGNILTHDI